MKNNNIKTFISNDEQKKIMNEEFSKFEVNSNNEYVYKCYKTNEWTLTIYKNNNCVLMGKNIDEIVKLLKLNNFIEQIGMDEVGVGDYFGGIVVCAVYLSKSDFNKIKELNIKDSKKLDNNSITEIASKLIKLVKFSVCQVYPNEYNELYDKFKNTHIIKTILHNNALINLINSNKIDYKKTKIILDQYVDKQNYYKYLKTIGVNEIIEINEFETQAESKYISVACASIIARFYFLNQINDLSNKIGFQLPLGAWNEKINFSSKLILEKFGMDTFKKYVKLHFKNTKKLL